MDDLEKYRASIGYYYGQTLETLLWILIKDHRAHCSEQKKKEIPDFGNLYTTLERAYAGTIAERAL